ncbi:MAG: hypothetical protein AUK34_09615 [Ignavibacteria bacterium CG2_30_36_16]|nr:DUF3109 family protein [Ignavibacteria bacterium]OIP58276.1 MAG: hypothetical protein AUK34_09615 [Ignavibacteria bacterium CG2_30_36_16]
MYTSNIVPVEDVLVRQEIFDVQFSCDLQMCKGACCTLKSDLGAPLKKEEVEKITGILNDILPYLPEEHQNEINSNGFYEEKIGELLTRSINSADCVFVTYDGDIAKCGIEKAFFDGKIDFRKPISCHLFPIRVSNFGGEVLRYESIRECEPALKKGEEDNIAISEFCKDSLIRKYGKNWYTNFIEAPGK